MPPKKLSEMTEQEKEEHFAKQNQKIMEEVFEVAKIAGFKAIDVPLQVLDWTNSKLINYMVEKLWEKYDKNKNGTLEPEEAKHVAIDFIDMYYNMSWKKTEAVVKDQEEELTPEQKKQLEAEKNQTKNAMVTMIENDKNYFDSLIKTHFDKNGDGKMSKEEMFQYIKDFEQQKLGRGGFLGVPMLIGIVGFSGISITSLLYCNIQ